MLDVTISQIVNEIDQTEYVLYTEWTSTSFKIMLFKSSMEPLMGEMLDNDINFYSKEHSKSCNEYLQETRDALSGKDTEIQYFLQDNKFEWRRNKKWILGSIMVCPASNILVISETLFGLLKWHQHLQEVISKVRKENELLSEAKKELCLSIEEMIKVKINMEKELYQKFLLLLNAKKEKIRELEDLLNYKKNEKKTVFDACTDQSEDSDTKQTFVKTKSNIKKREQKLMFHESTDQGEDTDMDDRQSFHVPSKQCKSVISDDFRNETEGTASTSKEMYKTMPRDPRFIASSVSSDESECELNLKIQESCPMTKSNISHIEFQEESEDELFP